MDKRVVLIDDHTLVRAGLRALIDELPGYQVVAEGEDGSAVPALLARHAPDVLVMDISMPGVSGIQALRALRQRGSDLPVVMLSMHADRETVLDAIRAGASAYLLKDAAEAELELALRSVLAEQQYLSPRVSGEVINAMLEPRTAAVADPLTPRQREVLRLLALGKAAKEVAWELELSIKTVETHRAQLMERLGIHDVAGLVVYALRRKIVDMSEFPR
ncbi:MAG: response regulator transcription factor [Spongiibacteraceae bacterium]|jgi:DNA-binding NarL/FixJ family response regulator|nr:response regulator transcription factor [Spongiibacteraceae bacterium]